MTLWGVLRETVDGDTAPKTGPIGRAGIVLLVIVLLALWQLLGREAFLMLAIGVAWISILSASAAWMERDTREARSYATHLLCLECQSEIGPGQAGWRDDQPLCPRCDRAVARGVA